MTVDESRKYIFELIKVQANEACKTIILGNYAKQVPIAYAQTTPSNTHGALSIGNRAKHVHIGRCLYLYPYLVYASI